MPPPVQVGGGRGRLGGRSALTRRAIRADKEIEKRTGRAAPTKLDELSVLWKEHGVVCPSCSHGDVTGERARGKPPVPTAHGAHADPAVFNLLFETAAGAATSAAKTFLRPETAQGAYVSFTTAATAGRAQLPFGVGQIGRSFRNEISPQNFLFRTREFEQAELQFFSHAEEADKWCVRLRPHHPRAAAHEWHRRRFDHWLEESRAFLLSIGVRPESIRVRPHEANVRAPRGRGRPARAG